MSSRTHVNEWLLAGSRVPLPRHLIIEITSYCNLRCRMCPKTNKHVNTAENKVMAWETFERLLPLLPHIESLDLSGVWGEAFMHPELYIRMLKAIKAQGSDVYTISNGTLITDDLARQLVECDLNKLTVSLDAATPETFAKVRPPGKLEDVLTGLRAVRDWKKRLNSAQPRLDLAFVGMKANIGEFPAVIRLAAELGVAEVCLQAMGEYPGLENESVATHHKALGRTVYAESLALARELGVKLVLHPDDQFEEDRGERNAVGDSAGRRKDCYDLWNRALVAATGDILPCCASPMSMGNLKDRTFDEIWRGKAYNALRRQFLTGKIPEMCRQCTGTAWVDQSLFRDLRFFASGLAVPRVKRRVKRKLRTVPALRWVKGHLDRARGKGEKGS